MHKKYHQYFNDFMHKKYYQHFNNIFGINSNQTFMIHQHYYLFLHSKLHIQKAYYCHKMPERTTFFHHGNAIKCVKLNHSMTSFFVFVRRSFQVYFIS